MKVIVKHVPLVMYFPKGTWDHYLNNNFSQRIRIMDVTELSKYGSGYSESTILSWLNDVVEYGDKSTVISKPLELLEDKREKVKEESGNEVKLEVLYNGIIFTICYDLMKQVGTIGMNMNGVKASVKITYMYWKTYMYDK